MESKAESTNQPAPEAVIQKTSTECVLTSVPLRVLALVVLLLAAPLQESFRVTAFFNGDIWWHLQSGLWMLQNHAIPRNGVFSQYPDKSWIASSWVFELLVAGAYKLIGLKAICAVLMVFKVVLAAVTFLLVYAVRRQFWLAVLLSAIAQYALVDLQPLPILFSVLLFGVELLLLMRSRRMGDVRPLYFLPLLFFFWANLHPLFIYGLLLLLLFLMSGAVEKRLPVEHGKPGISLVRSLAVAGLSCFATLLTPYSIHLYPDIAGTLFSKVQFISFTEMSAMAFRRPENFVLLLLVMAAFFALGRQRSRDLFKILAMGVFVMIAFRLQRDAWTIVLLSLAVLAEAVPQLHGVREPDGAVPLGNPSLALVSSLVVILLGAAIYRLPGNSELLKRASAVFPVQACDFLRSSQLPGPLFNDYSWGGFLDWYLPEYPVAIDGRINLYGVENEKYFKLTAGGLRLEESPAFSRARTLLLEQNSGMAKALTNLPSLRDQFRIVYQDHVAMVLVRTSGVE